jgi:hypothetical protein
MEIFTDPTPNGIVNQRLVTTMVQVAERTNMNSQEKQDFLNLLLLTGILPRFFNSFTLLDFQ